MVVWRILSLGTKILEGKYVALKGNNGGLVRCLSYKRPLWYVSPTTTRSLHRFSNDSPAFPILLQKRSNDDPRI